MSSSSSSSSSSSNSAPLTLFFNTKRGISSCDITHNDSDATATKEQQLCIREYESVDTETCGVANEGVIYSPNGQYMAIIYREKLCVYDISRQSHDQQGFRMVKCITGELGSSISEAQFSPLNTFLVTLGKYSPHKSTLGNLIVWKLFPEAGEESEAEESEDNQSLSCKVLLRTKYNKASGSDIWPIVQWNDNESICAIWQQNQQSLNFYKYAVPKVPTTTAAAATAAATGTSSSAASEEEEEEHIPQATHANEKQFELVSRFKKPKVLKYSMSSKTTFSIHTFNAQTQQHLVQIYRYPNFKKPTCFISFASERRGVEVDVDMKWNRIGSALLVHAHSSTDTDNQNYYGKSQVYFLRSNGHFTCQVTLSQTGPVHDVAWSPKGNEFCLVYGYTPAKATLYNESTQVIYEFGTGTRNKCSWSPNGKMLVLAGFGSLTGRMEFWDRDKKRMIGQAEAKEASVYAWSRDSRLFLTATVTPTLRVSNKIQLWKYNGVLLNEKHFDTLYGAHWNHFVPALAISTAGEEESEESNNKQSKEQDKDYRPISPRALNEGKLLMQTQVSTVKKAYVPPSLRGLGPVDDDIFKRSGVEAPSRPVNVNKKAQPTIQQQQAKVAQLQRMIPGLPTSAAIQQINVTSGGANAMNTEAAKKKRKRKKKKKADGSSTGADEDGDDDQSAP